MAIKCSACQSDNVQKVSLVYENGISSINGRATTSGLGVSRGGLGLGVARAKINATQQTELSKKASPPAKKRFIRNLALYLIGISFVPSLMASILGIDNLFLRSLVFFAYIGLAIVHLVNNYKYNKNVWPPLYQAWDSQYMCQTCGVSFTPAAVGEPVVAVL